MKYPLFLLVGMLIFSCGKTERKKHYYPQSGASQALEEFAILRSYPNGSLNQQSWISEYYQMKRRTVLRQERQWQSLGPKNIGGRTLCLAFHPDDPELIYAGSASGGLWKTASGGLGENAWERIPIGHPAMGIGAIAIHPEYPDQMLIGTGEVYNYGQPAPGIINRLTRGTYGMGILRSVDGGVTWTNVLSWNSDELTGVQDIVFDNRGDFVYAATTEGVYRSRNGGISWTLINENKMAVDIEIIPSRPGHLWITFGSLNNDLHGVFHSTDFGESFVKADFMNYTGKAVVSFSRVNPDIGYVYLANALNGKGLFKTVDGGAHWTLHNFTDITRYQGWYSLDIAVNPEDETKILCAGIEVWGSWDGGATLVQRSRPKEGYMGLIPAGDPEGTEAYVHADVHRIYYHPALENVVYFATDGGIFRSDDGGNSFQGCNGGYTTTQFYAEFAVSRMSSDLSVGGMQDNGTAMYNGDQNWSRILGGDGMSAVLPVSTNNPLFASMQHLQLRKSVDYGGNFVNISPYIPDDENRAFNAPFVLSPSATGVLYAGTERLYQTINGGESWNVTNEEPLSGKDPILKIAVSKSNPNVLYLCTAPLETGLRKIFRSNNSGKSFTDISSDLPNRICTDIAIHSQNEDIVYAVFSGFGSPHVFKTIDAGASWEEVSEGIPDLPANAIVVDEIHPDFVYMGNDMGVFASSNGGSQWEYISQDLPDVTMVTDLQISYPDRQLVVVTHGSGVYETELLHPVITEPEGNVPVSVQMYPNPTEDIVNVVVSDSADRKATLNLFDIKGNLLQTAKLIDGRSSFKIGSLPHGAYFIVGKEQSAGVLFYSKVVRRGE